ncbi:MAG: sensor histidine kinase [Marmoricola sp.]|nr:sensor histidine kinase [Marmoricola sp.]
MAVREQTPLSGAVRDLLSGQHADPRAAQGVVLVPVLLEALLHLVTASPLDPWFGLGTSLVLAVSIGAWLIGTGTLAPRWTVLLPVLDVVALGLMRLAPGTAVGVAVVFPAMWLGLQFRRRGVVLVAATVLAAFVVPTTWRLGTSVASVSKISQMTLMAIVVSLVVCLTAELWAEQLHERHEAAERLEQAVRDLTEQRRLTRTIVHGVDVGLVAIDPAGTYDWMNPRQVEFLALGYPDGHRARAGQTGHVFAADGRTPLPSEEMPTVRAMQGEAFRDLLVWVGREPTQRRALAVSATPYDRADGSFGGAVLAYHDITELVLASRIKEEFVASVSHELRTPLTSIIGYVDVVLEDVADLPGPARHYLETVQRNAHRLHRLVDDLLSTALESVASVIEVEHVRVADVLGRSVSDVTKAAEASDQTVWFDVLGDDAHGAQVEGDPGRLAQVFDNLLGNAVKYTGRGGHVVGAVLVEGDEVVVRVRDTGRGIAEHEQAAIFGTFFRSTSVVGEAIPGVGLGLAIAKTIVDAHGGTMGVSSVVGRGATFEVRLPLLGARSREPVGAASVSADPVPA